MAMMRLASLIFALLLPSVVPAKAWQGIEPGKSTADEVGSRFGEPTSRVKRGNRLVLAYKGDQALPGTKEAQFHCRADGVVEEITVFLSAPLDGESIEGTYGKPTSKTFTDSFQKVWQYPQKGVMVFFDREGTVQAITFNSGTAARGAEKGADKPHAEPKSHVAPEKSATDKATTADDAGPPAR
jgi:hypothetical protein